MLFQTNMYQIFQNIIIEQDIRTRKNVLSSERLK